jgi:RNA polymerase sigma factor (sigma-70 family)
LPNRQQIEHIVTGCISANRQSQKELYQNYYGFATSICMRYSNVNNDTIEIVNDGFLKIFKSIHLFVPKYENFETSLLGWMKSILVHTAIDHFRKNGKNYLVGEVADETNELANTDVSAIDKMSYKEIIELVQKLSPVYRTVFNMFVIDGYKHEEIAEHLHISVGTSKSNLAKAKANIKKMLSTPKFKLYGIRAI